MIVKRIGNDFVLTWIINRDGLPLDFTGAFDEQLQLVHLGKSREIPFQRTGNSIRIEFTPELAPHPAIYSFQYFFKLPDPTFRGGYRNRAIDANVVKIVPYTSPAETRDTEVITNLKTRYYED